MSPNPIPKPPTMKATKVTLKLLVYQAGKRVLFAEAGKDFVDFLFSLQSLPLGTVTKLLGTKKMAGCLGNLYESIENLDATYMQPNQSKHPLLNPTTSIVGSQAPLLLPKSACLSLASSISSSSSSSRDLYKCTNQQNYSNCRSYVAEDPTSVCPNCRGRMSVQATYVAPQSSSPNSSASGGEGGYVKAVVTYMVMDDLVVKPLSTISCIAMLNHCNVKDLGSIKEKVVELGIEEGMELLRASMTSNTVLTDVFFSEQ